MAVSSASARTGLVRARRRRRQYAPGSQRRWASWTDGQPSLRARLLELVDAVTEHLGFVPAMRLDGLLDTVVPAAVAGSRRRSLSE